MEQNSLPPEPSDDFAGFPDKIREDVEGLMWLGYLEDTFFWCGHEFTIRTLHGAEELDAGLVVKEYVETVGQDKALTWATIGLSLVSIDGEEDFCPPIGRDDIAYARGRFRYVSKQWFWPTAYVIWSHYANLLQRQTEAIKVVEDLFEGSLPTFSPFADSLTDRASSVEIVPPQEEPEEDIREYLDD